jgi:nucleotidyltransferase/DNA polymerase involved in DNA repair
MTPSWQSEPEGVFLDLRGLQRLHGPGADGAVKICTRAQAEFPVWSAGLASSPLASRLASLAGRQGTAHGLFAVPHGAVPSFLSGFSIQVLNHFFREVPRLRALGIRTLGDLQVLPESLLIAVFGTVGSRLAKEARGVHSGTQVAAHSKNEAKNEATLVAKIVFAKPLASVAAERALRQALAMRALSRGGGAGNWCLTVSWYSGTKVSVTLPGPVSESWTTWLALMDGLWAKLPRHRQGIHKLELFFQGRDGTLSQQLTLFESPGGSNELSRAIARIRQKIDPSFAPASEALLRQWGARWGKES